MDSSEQTRTKQPRLVEPTTSIEQRAATVHASTRRRMAFRSTVLLALAAVGLCFFVAWRRDHMNIQDRLDTLAPVVKALQAHVDKFGRLPAMQPEFEQAGLSYYVSDADRYYVSKTTDTVIIGSTHPTPLVSGEDGRAVILYTQGKIKAEWMPVSQYDKRWTEQQDRIEQFEQQRRAQPVELP